jgi:hypothetical protein
MTLRVLRGKHPSGAYGFWVSKPGIDVVSATVMGFAFSSDFVPPVMVIQGSTVSGPTNGPGPFKAGSVPGAERTVNTIGYGRTVSPIPAAFGIATAPNWTLPLAVATGQLGYLAGRWHTHVYETCDNNTVIGEYGPQIVKTPNTQDNQVSVNWHSAQFILVPYTDRIEIITNNRNNVTIKYLVLENRS